ncbi:MAG: carboxypeptidase-like regulatory domain-containing protein [Bacteroidota bacterium]
MKTRFRNQMHMNRTALKVCEEEAALINTIAELANSVQAVKTKEAELEHIIEEQELSIMGVTENKNRIKEKLVRETVHVAGSIYAYASKTENYSLMGEVRVTDTFLKRKPDHMLIPFCQGIYDLAMNIGTVILNSYGADNTVLSEMNTVLDKFKLEAEAPEVANSRSVSNNRKIAKLIREIRLLWTNEVDKMMLVFRDTNDRFYMEFENARQIIDTGHHKSNVESEASVEAMKALVNISVIDANTNLPVEGATVTLGKDNLTDESDEDGYSLIEAIDGGTHNLRIECEGYETYVDPNVKVENGEEVDLTIYLVPIENANPTA